MAVLARQPLATATPLRVAYRRILVPLIDTDCSEQAMGIACQLAEDRGAGVTAVSVVEVPVELPLDAHMLDADAHAKHVLEQAQAIGDLYGVRVAPRVLRARAAGEAIVEEATRACTEIIVLRAPRKQRSQRSIQVFGKTVDYVMKRSPCRVMVAASPGEGC
jgi:basic amino acid/polyamine antiporter, APA family